MHYPVKDTRKVFKNKTGNHPLTHIKFQGQISWVEPVGQEGGERMEEFADIEGGRFHIREKFKALMETVRRLREFEKRQERRERGESRLPSLLGRGYQSPRPPEQGFVKSPVSYVDHRTESVGHGPRGDHLKNSPSQQAYA